MPYTEISSDEFDQKADAQPKQPGRFVEVYDDELDPPKPKPSTWEKVKGLVGQAADAMGLGEPAPGKVTAQNGRSPSVDATTRPTPMDWAGINTQTRDEQAARDKDRLRLLEQERADPGNTAEQNTHLDTEIAHTRRRLGTSAAAPVEPKADIASTLLKPGDMPAQGSGILPAAPVQPDMGMLNSSGFMAAQTDLLKRQKEQDLSEYLKDIKQRTGANDVTARAIATQESLAGKQVNPGSVTTSLMRTDGSMPRTGKDGPLAYGVDQAQSMVGGGLSALGSWLDSDLVRRVGGELEDQSADIAAGGYSSSYKQNFRETLRHGGLTAGLGWIAEKGLENAPNSGFAIAGSAAATLAAPFSAPLATALAGGTAFTNWMMNTGDVASELKEKGVTGPMADQSALIAGGVAAWLDSIGAGKMFPKDKLLTLTTNEVVMALAQSGKVGAAKIVAKEVLKNTGIEVGTEGLQKGVAIGAAAAHGAKYTPTEIVDKLIDEMVASTGAGTAGSVTSAGMDVAASNKQRIMRNELGASVERGPDGAWIPYTPPALISGGDEGDDNTGLHSLDPTTIRHRREPGLSMYGDTLPSTGPERISTLDEAATGRQVNPLGDEAIQADELLDEPPPTQQNPATQQTPADAGVVVSGPQERARAILERYSMAGMEAQNAPVVAAIQAGTLTEEKLAEMERNQARLLEALAKINGARAEPSDAGYMTPFPDLNAPNLFTGGQQDVGSTGQSAPLVTPVGAAQGDVGARGPGNEHVVQPGQPDAGRGVPDSGALVPSSGTAAPAGHALPAASALKRKQAPSNNLIKRIQQLGGINIAYLADVTGERTPKGLPVGLFAGRRKDGKGAPVKGHGLDTLAVQLADEGFPINVNDPTDNGGVNQLTELIKNAIAGRPVLNHAGQQEAMEADAKAQERARLFERAAELGINTSQNIKTDVLRARVNAEIARLEAEVSSKGEAVADDFEDIPFTHEELAAAKTGSEDDLFGDLDEQGTEAGIEAPAGATAEGGAAEGAATDRVPETAQGDEEQDAFALGAQTPEETKARAEARAKAEAEAKRKAAADDMRGDFTLTGSDRAADQAAARGQNELFGQNGTPEKKQASANTVFTEDAAAAARALLKKKLSQLNAGIDPEIMQAGITLAGYHIEKGARTFAAYAKAMVEDLGDVVIPYLKSWYMGVKYDPRAAEFAKDMTDAGMVENFDVEDVRTWSEQRAPQAPEHGKSATLNQGDTTDAERPQLPEQGRTETGDHRADRGNGRGGEPSGRPLGGGLAEADSQTGTRGAPAASGEETGGTGTPGAGVRGTESVGGRDREPSTVRDRPERPPSGLTGQPPETPSSEGVSLSAEPKEDFTLGEDTAEAISEGGQRTKARNNIAAIKLVRRLESEDRRATVDEQKTLAKYVGWGGIKQIFDENKADWAALRDELKALLSQEEYAAARRSMLDAHFTSPDVVNGMWQAAHWLGFRGGRVLEPSMGVGNFFGAMPKDLRANSTLFGIELDNITGLIAKYLYPNATVATPMGFQDVDLPSNSFDLATGNPPFGEQSLYDKKHPDLRSFNIHQFFFAKSLDKVRPGGILQMVVSRYLMDARDGGGHAAREYLGKRARLLGAIRLPYNAFLGNANTEVVTDIIFLQKLGEGEVGNSQEWMNVDDIETAHPKTGEKFSFPINRYFIDNPHMVVGTHAPTGKMRTANQYNVEPRADEGLLYGITKAIENLPRDVYVAAEKPLAEIASADAVVPDGVKVYGYYLNGETVMQRLPDAMGKRQGQAVEFKDATAPKRAARMVQIRDTLRSLMRLELSEDATEGHIKVMRATLNEQYDAFVKMYGYINQQTNRRAFRDDPDLPLLESLEPGFDPGIGREAAKKRGEPMRKPSAQKADIFTKRVLSPYASVKSAASAKDALIASMNERGRVDPEFMADMYGKTWEDTRAELGDLVYLDPSGAWETADAYLSGNVKAKLKAATAAAQRDPQFKANVEALQAVQPADVPAMRIAVRIGSPWVPGEDMERFATETWGAVEPRIRFVPQVAKWSVMASVGDEIARNATWGTRRMDADEILLHILNNKAIVIKDNIGTKSEPKWVVNEPETEAARAKAQEMSARFKEWIWQDEERRTSLERIYNDNYNTDRRRTYDGSHLTLPGSSPAIQLRPHQKNAIWRAIQDKTILLDQAVGAGKTFVMAGIAMEQRRLGTMRKPMFIVPNSLVRQWRDEFYRLYPNANVLAATEADFAKANRKRFMAKIATGDWDAVIIAHSSFKKVGMPIETEREILDEQMQEITDAIENVKMERGDKHIQRDMERTREKIKEKLKALADRAGKKDDTVFFNELGVDGLFLDEAHLFKNLFYVSGMRNVAGLGNPTGSGRAFDLFAKLRYLNKRYAGKATVVFATGTPVSNSLVEMFTMQRYLAWDKLKDKNMHMLDAWAGVYGDVQNVYEVHPSGTGYRLSTRFAKFVNLPSLMNLYRGFADVITLDDLKRQAKEAGGTFPVPKIKGGKPNNIVAERSDQQRQFFGVPMFQRDLDGNITFELNDDPQVYSVEQNKDGKFVILGRDKKGNGLTGKSYDTAEEANEEMRRLIQTPKVGWNENSILWKFENLKRLNKETNGKINALSITNEARKAGLDYRLIDQQAPDFAGSKINLAVDNIVRIHKNWAPDRGAQLVFCDLSVPKSAKAKAAATEQDAFVRDEDGGLRKVKATVATFDDIERAFLVVKSGPAGAHTFSVYDGATGGDLEIEAPTRAEAVKALRQALDSDLSMADKLEQFSEIDESEIADWKEENEKEDAEEGEDGADGISVADLLAMAGSGNFSVYDDLKTKLIGKGIPEAEIAFIHDYDTAVKKNELFKKVRAGEIRVLLGSTEKMGAGMNVQERLVALHHLDAPWRPSDLEQREGRIIRQGNELYKRDPDGFEIEIIRYGTRQTYDTRMWQIIEHKAAGVEQLRKASDDLLEIDDVGGEAANAADMKAAASGNPLILDEIRLRNEVKSLEAQQSGHMQARIELQNKLKWNRGAPERERESLAELEPFIAARDANPAKPFAYRHDGKTYAELKQAITPLSEAFVAAAKGLTAEKTPAGEYRGVQLVFLKKLGSIDVWASIGKEAQFVSTYTLEDKFSPSGFFQRVDNALDGMVERRDAIKDEASRQLAEIPKIEEELAKPFAKEADLREKRAKHREVVSLLAKAGGGVELTPEMQAELKLALVKRQIAGASGVKLSRATVTGPSGRGYSVSEPNKPYSHDIFGNPLPETPGARGDRKRAPAAQSRNVGSTPAIPAGRYGTTTKLVTHATREIGARRVTTVDEAATAMAYLGRGAVERFDGLVTDKHGKPLALVGSFKGAMTTTSVYPSTIVAEAFRIPGAAHIWFAHNHPSGTPVLSKADFWLTEQLENVFSGTGIQTHGTLALTQDGKYGHTMDGQGTIKPAQGAMKLGAVEREFDTFGRIGGAFSSPVAAMSEAPIVSGGETGLVLLDAQNFPIAFLPMRPDEALPLKNNGRLDALYRAMSYANAAGAILYDPKGGFSEAQYRNVGSALAPIDVKLLDVLQGGVSLREKGKSLAGLSVLSRSNKDASGIALRDAEATIARLAKGYRNLPPIVLHANPGSLKGTYAALLKEIKDAGAMNDAEAAFHDGKIHVFIEHLEDTARLEHVLFTHEITHYGLRGVFGPELDPILDHLWRSSIALQAKAAKKKADYGLDSTIEAVEEVLADMAPADLVKLKGWHKLVLFVRDWLDRHGFSALAGKINAMLESKLGQEGAADLMVADVVTKAREWARTGKRGANSVYMGATRMSGAQSGESFAADVLAELADVDELFRFKVSKARSISGVMAEVYPGAKYLGEDPDTESWNEFGADRRFNFTNPLGQRFYVYQTNDGRVWIDVSRVSEGSGGGAVYAAVANYAFNTGRVFVSDPAGLSEAAAVRRTSHMLSSALRYGTTRHIEPSPEQLKGNAETGRAPLKWAGTDVDKVRSLIHTFLSTTYAQNQELKDYSYDFGTRQFVDKHGNPVTFGRFVAGSKRGAARASRTGAATMRRGIFLQSLVSASVGERPGILDDVLNGARDLVTRGGLRALFSRRQTPPPGWVSASGARQSTLPGLPTQPPVQTPVQATANLQGGAPGNRNSWNAQDPSKMDDIIYKLQDRHIDLKRAIQSIKDAGRAIQDKWDAYMAEELFHGRVAKRVQDFADRELTPLLKDMKARGVTIEELDTYLWARHAQEANDLIRQRDPAMQDGGSGLTDAAARDVLAGNDNVTAAGAPIKGVDQAKLADLQAIAATVDGIIDTTRGLYVSYGLESLNTVQEWGTMFKHYVPLMREDHDGGMGIGQGFSIKGRETKHRTGSTSGVVNILANIAMQREKAITRGEKNRVAVALAGLVKLNPAPDFWSFDTIPQERVLNERTGLVETREVPNYRQRANVIIAKIKDRHGEIKERAIVLNEDNDRAMRLATAFKNLDTAGLEGLLGVSAAVTRYIASVNTRYNPVFGVVNLVRDVQGAMLNLSSTPLANKRALIAAHTLSALRGIYADARAYRKGRTGTSAWAQLWEEFTSLGGQTGYREQYRTSDDRLRDMRRVMDPTNWTRTKWGRFFTSGGVLKVPMTTVQKGATPLFNWLSDYNLAMENAVRLSAYKVALEQGTSKARAASLAKNLTVNFNRRGAVGLQAGALYAFFNASMQGTARIAETMLSRDANGRYAMTKAGRRIILGGVMLGAMNALALAAMGFGDDEPPEWVRERNLVIPIGDKRYITIPMPLGYHVIPNIGRVMTEYALGGFKHGTRRFVGLLGSFAEAFNPVGGGASLAQIVSFTPTDPLVAISENKDWTGNPIAREDISGLSPTPGHTRAKDTATPVAKVLAEAINAMTGGTDFAPGEISPTPDQIDYLIGQATGGVGREAGKLMQSITAWTTGEDLPPHKIPLVGRFYGNADSQSAQSSRFFKNLKDVSPIRREYEALRKERKLLEANEFLAENPVAAIDPDAAYQDVQKLRTEKRRLIMSDAEREKVRRIDERLQARMRQFNERVAELEKTQ